MFGLTLLDTPRPIIPGLLPTRVPEAYVTLLSTWGPGWLCDTVELPDPREPDGLFALLQQRYRLHVQHQRSMGRWIIDDELAAHGVVVARTRDGTAWLARSSDFIGLDAARCVRFSIEDWLHAHRSAGADRATYRATYRAQPSRRPELYAALRDGDESAADALLPVIAEAEPAAMFELAWELATRDDLPREARADMFDRCMRIAKRRDADAVAGLPVRQIREAIRAGDELGHDRLGGLESLALVQGPFHGPTTDVERSLAATLVENRQDRATCGVLADHLESIGQTVRAKLFREQSESMSPSEVAARKLVAAPVEADEILARWRDAWATDDPDTSIEPLWEAIRAQPLQLRHAIVSSIVYGRSALLREEKASVVYAVLGVRSREVEECLAVIRDLARPEAARYLYVAIRRPSYLPARWIDGRKRPDGMVDMREDLALAFHAVGGNLSAEQVDEVLGWLEGGEYRLRVAALCLLQKSGKQDRVLEACLAHFVEGHPYTERAIAKRKKDPRVLPAILAAFERVEKTALVDGRTVHYSDGYRILARYLAQRLGNERGKAAWERCKLKGRIDRAESQRESRREGQ